MDQINEFIAFLKAQGFVIKQDDHYPDVYYATTEKIRAAFGISCEVHRDELVFGFMADNAKAFNKWSQCPMVMPLFEAMENRVALMQHLTYLASEDGYQWSTTFGYLDDKRLPYSYPMEATE